MADILEILDKGQILTDIDAVIAGITKLEEKITEASSKVLSIKVDLQGAESLEALTAATRQYQQAAIDLGAVQKQNYSVLQQSAALSEKYTATLTENAETLAFLRSEHERVKDKLKSLTGEVNAGVLSAEKYTRSIVALTEEELVLRQAINETTAEMRKQTDIGLDKQARKDAIAVEKHVQSEIQLYNSLAGVRKEMIKLEMSGQKMSAEYAALSVRAKQLSQAQIEVNNETKGSLSLFTRFGDLFERMGLRIVASLVWWSAVAGAISLVYEWMTKLTDEEQKAIDATDEYNESIKSLNKTLEDLKNETNASLREERDVLQNLLKIYRQSDIELDLRIKAYQKMQSMYSNALEPLTDEEIKTKQVTAAHEADLKVLQKYADQQLFVANGRKAMNKLYLDKEKGKSHAEELFDALSPDAKRAANILIDNPDIDISSGRKSRQQVQQKGGFNFESGSIDAAREYVKVLNEVNAKETSINVAKVQQLQNEKDLLKMEKLIEPKKKVKKTPKDNAKGLEAELSAEKEHYKIRQELDQKEYDESRKTFVEQQIFDERKKEAALEHATEMLSIIEKYHGKVGESEAKFTARKLQATADQFSVDNAANEDEKKIAQEIQKRHIQAEKDIDSLIKKLSDERDKIRDINRDIDEINSASLAHKERANGVSPFLEALGYDADFQENMAAFDRQIKAAEEKRADLYDKRSNAVNTGSGVEVGKVDVEIAGSNKDIAQLEADKQKAIDDKKIQAKKEAAEKAIELAKTTWDAIKQIQEQQFAWEQRQLDIKMEQVRLQSEQQMQAIDATAGFQIDKDNQKAKVAAQTASEEKDIQAKSNALKLRQARFEKESAEMTIIANTSSAIVKTIAAYAGIPGGMAIAAPIIALEAAIGAAQYAVAASQPLPQFEKGGITETPHFIAAEGNKPELIIAPSGDVSIASKEGIYTAPVGSTVKNASDTEKLLKYAINGIGINGMSMGMLMEQRTKQMTDKRIVEELQDVKAEIIRSAYIGRVINNNVVIKGNDLQRPTRN